MVRYRTSEKEEDSITQDTTMPSSNGKTDGDKSKRSRWDVVHLESLPHFLKDNEFLIWGHRPQLNSVKECCKSTFRMHTETLNIWTHLVGCVGCICLASYYLLMFTSDMFHGAAFSVFFFGAIFCLGASTTFHMFICHSEPVCKVMAKIDYCGVIILIVSSFMPWVYFGFYCHDQTVKVLYIGGISGLGLLCIWVVLQDRFREPRYRALRAGLFIALGLTGLVPGIHYIVTDGQVIGYHDWLIFMAVLYVAGGVIYAMRIPERLWPGKFDIWCQSHQILHLCVIGGVMACYHGVSKLADHRISLGDQVCTAAVQ